MGYYLDLYSESESETKSTEEIVDEFCLYGSFRIEDEEYPDFTEVLFRIPETKIQIIITFLKAEEHKEGYFGYIRLWSTISKEECESTLNSLLQLSKKIGFKIHDPQLNAFLDKKTLNLAVKKVQSNRVKLSNLLDKALPGIDND
jgi:hypothetical protein